MTAVHSLAKMYLRKWLSNSKELELNLEECNVTNAKMLRLLWCKELNEVKVDLKFVLNDKCSFIIYNSTVDTKTNI